MPKDMNEENLQNPKVQGSEEIPKKEKKKSGMLFAILTLVTAILVILAVTGGTFYLVIHNNVNGLADKYGNNIKNIPLLRLALPKTVVVDEFENLDRDQLLKLYKESKAQNEELTKQLEEVNKLNKELEKYKTEADRFTAENERAKAENEKERAELEEYKKKIDELVANGDKEGFADYFVKINSETAEKVYKAVMEEKKADDAAKQFAQLYEKMDTGSSAKIFEQLGTEKLDLISYTLKNMKKDVAAEILAEMSKEFATKVTEKLAKDYGIVLP